MSTVEQQTSAYYGATAGAIIGDSFYVIGGSGATPPRMDSLHVIPLAAGKTRRVGPAVPTPRNNVVAVAVGDRMYTLAGILSGNGDSNRDGPCDVVEAFDTCDHTWHSCAPLPAVRVKPGVAAVGQVIYALGGREDALDASTIFAYDTVADRWSQVGRLPYAARHGAACALNGKIYYSGGFTAGPDRGKFQRAMSVFDPDSGSVSLLADLPAPRTAHAMIAAGDAIFVIGGVDESKTPTADVFRYDIDHDIWNACEPLSSPRAVFACGVLGDEMRVAGGWRRMGKDANDSDQRYSLG